MSVEKATNLLVKRKIKHNIFASVLCLIGIAASWHSKIEFYGVVISLLGFYLVMVIADSCFLVWRVKKGFFGNTQQEAREIMKIYRKLKAKN